ncbi:hypothetical protein BOTBODRAFT_38344 [Botryobasidium botryosum FD-172 SS1]|uniref:DUF4211 domain-containing protein n=1 Tax=Botryobasidium botryosum (strain FD-172 SS1) TaxID=930990 RepID=A0A067LZU5_BOTB1|nr:hypothetical protein BOTBODRAFT_38344 [Botryobasidium botryosum FD-172 SS1]
MPQRTLLQYFSSSPAAASKSKRRRSPSSSPPARKPKGRLSKWGQPEPSTDEEFKPPSVPDPISDDDQNIRGIQFAAPSQPKRAPVIVLSSDDSQSTSESDDEAELTSPTLRKRKGVSRLAKRKTRAPSTPTSGAPSQPPEPQESSDGAEASQESWTPPRSRKSPSKKQRVIQDSGDESEPVKKRRLLRGRRPPTPSDDEDEDLINEIEPSLILDDKPYKPKRTKYSKGLAALRRRLGGRKTPSPEPSDEDESGDDNIILFKGARPDDDSDNGVTNISSDDDDTQPDDTQDSFIVQDDDSSIQLPDEFSMDAHQDLSHHFKVICQLFVHMACKPASKRLDLVEQLIQESYFSIPLAVARRKLSGIKDSLVTSSVWTTKFKRTLELRHNLTLTYLEYAVPGCDACRLGGRLATVVARLTGKQYSKETYEVESDSEDEDDDSENDNNENDSEEDEGGAIAKMEEFNLGKFCAKRTRVWHLYTHWEYNLFHALLEEVESLRNPGSSRGFVRTRWGSRGEIPKNIDNPDEVMDWLDRRGIIQQEWQKIQNIMERAHTLQKGGDDDLD